MTVLETSGNFCNFLEPFETLRTFSYFLDPSWIFSNFSYPSWTLLNLLKPTWTSWTFLRLLEPLWTFINLHDTSWTFFNLHEHSGVSLKLLEPSGTLWNLLEPSWPLLKVEHLPCKQETGVRFPTAPKTFSPEGLASLVIRLLGGQRVKVSGMSVLFNWQSVVTCLQLHWDCKIWDPARAAPYRVIKK